MEPVTWSKTDQYRIVGVSEAAESLRAKIRKYSRGPAPVIITGETGTGKELVARNLHHLGDRFCKPFIEVNCGSLTESLLEGELFGHEANAFTGAAKTGKPGKIEEANQGILFLDEICEMSYYSQVAFLRVLQEKAIVRVGSSRRINVDFRLISATNVRVEYALAEKRLREDFYYRIRGVPIEVPPLRERRKDIPLLVGYFLSKYAQEMKTSQKTVDPAAMMILMDYHWPGNIRQLDHAIAAMMYTDEPVVTQDTVNEILSGYSVTTASNAQRETLAAQCLDVGMDFEDFKRAALGVALMRAGGNQRKAANILGISYDSMRHYYKKHGFSRDTTNGDTEVPDHSNGNGNGNGELYTPVPVQPTVKPAETQK